MIRLLAGLFPSVADGAAVRWWVGLFSRKEPATSLALVRIFISAVLLYDLLLVGWYGLPGLLWAPMEAGGVNDVLGREFVPHVYRVLPGTEGTAVALWAACVVSVAMFGSGLLTRFSGVVLLLTYAQTALINNQADRGIDRMIRIILVLLLLSRCGAAWSIDAKIRTGRFAGDGGLIPSWPRYLIIAQLVLMYWCAGVEKFAVTWFPWGGYSALFIILQDPIFSVADWSFLQSPWLYWTTQVGTAVSHMWEWTVPLLLLSYWFRDTRDRPGRVRWFFNTARVRLWYVGIGMTFHLLLAATLRLGIFPWAMLAFYPAFFHPDEVRAAWEWVATRLGVDKARATG